MTASVVVYSYDSLEEAFPITNELLDSERAPKSHALLPVLLSCFGLSFLPPFSISRCPAFSARLRSVLAVKPAEYF